MQVVGVRALSDVPGTHFPRDSVAPADQRLSDQPLQLAAFQEVQLPSIQHCQRVLARGARPKVPASCIAVTVDGETTALAGTVAQVGPVQSGSSGYTYPTIIALPATSQGLHSGSTANVSITTGEASNVLAVPTSAVTTQGTNSYVLVLSSGTTKQKQIKVGIVGDIYTQVISGLQRGNEVVLADYSDAVPSSNTTTVGGLGTTGGLGGDAGFMGGASSAGIGGGGLRRWMTSTRTADMSVGG
jgi:multidrug efflux pump subunit AcrA (membrane-fusion protein)